LSDATSYVPGDSSSVKKQRTAANSSKDLSRNLQHIDDEIRRIIVIAEQRHLLLSSFFAHEFSQAPLALCDIHNSQLLNQQKKSAAIEFLKKQFPSSFSSSCPRLTGKCALIIDEGSLLEIRPFSRNTTVRQHAEQLLNTVIKHDFNQFDRIDVVFDSGESYTVKAFIKRNDNDTETPGYDLKLDDILDTSQYLFTKIDPY
ncbi:unnamed protein product, partial [Didymodactylos carnosus]